MQGEWPAKGKCDLICVDSYDNGILEGRLYSPPSQTSGFSSLSQFLIQIEDRLEQERKPQSQPVRFSGMADAWFSGENPPSQKKGRLATFRLKVLFRQHTSWQGTLQWLEGQQEKSFRSVLELIILMDSALKNEEIKKFPQNQKCNANRNSHPL